MLHRRFDSPVQFLRMLNDRFLAFSAVSQFYPLISVKLVVYSSTCPSCDLTVVRCILSRLCLVLSICLALSGVFDLYSCPRAHHNAYHFIHPGRLWPPFFRLQFVLCPIGQTFMEASLCVQSLSTDEWQFIHSLLLQ